MEVQVGAPMRAAISAVPYAPAVKIGLQFSRRFWEEDEHIFGGISYTDQPIRQIGYPNYGFNRGGKGVLLGAYLFGGANAYEFTAMSPTSASTPRSIRARRCIRNIATSSRTASPSPGRAFPFTLGCAGDWT